MHRFEVYNLSIAGRVSVLSKRSVSVISVQCYRFPLNAVEVTFHVTAGVSTELNSLYCIENAAESHILYCTEPSSQ